MGYLFKPKSGLNLDLIKVVWKVHCKFFTVLEKWQYSCGLNYQTLEYWKHQNTELSVCVYGYMVYYSTEQNCRVFSHIFTVVWSSIIQIIKYDLNTGQNFITWMPVFRSQLYECVPGDFKQIILVSRHHVNKSKSL